MYLLQYSVYEFSYDVSTMISQVYVVRKTNLVCWKGNQQGLKSLVLWACIYVGICCDSKVAGLVWVQTQSGLCAIC